ncbi:uncharacterized protein LOC112084162 [Eutrema salsugineum]|uniref:uncharacterized protein LOC112084162 n=1 Tax=Eutrema salsugineum TaxID=72664 RepID=UPI000CED612A|nr:uncharacterized protein LOC112084162 [Eutrema salsugineum]
MEDAEEWTKREDEDISPPRILRSQRRSDATNENTRRTPPPPGWFSEIRMELGIQKVKEAALDGFLEMLEARLGFIRIIFEVDAKELVEIVQGASQKVQIHPLCQDIRRALSCIPEAEVRFHVREGNKVADRIARMALSFVSDAPRLYTIMPEWIKHLALRDYPTL